MDKEVTDKAIELFNMAKTGEITQNEAGRRLRIFYQSQKKPQPTQSTKTGRNELCPCGSGKKYKKCCLT